MTFSHAKAAGVFPGSSSRLAPYHYLWQKTILSIAREKEKSPELRQADESPGLQSRGNFMATDNNSYSCRNHNVTNVLST